jgi:hypothetical protein
MVIQATTILLNFSGVSTSQVWEFYLNNKYTLRLCSFATLRETEKTYVLVTLWQ